ncbi:NAD(+) synthase [Myxococcota bacterium]|nr:NAD(+) synthase [Myxococcota bacterium]
MPRIALGQIEVVPGLPERNVERMLTFVDEAKRRGAELVAFPEMSVGGYLVGDRWLEDDFCRALMAYDDVLLDASRDIAIAWGNVHLDTTLEARGLHGWHPNEDGRTRRYNAMRIAQGGAWARRKLETPLVPAGVHVKTLLPNYRFFDDERYFFSLQDVAKDFGVPLESLEQPFVLTFGGREVLVGFELCEDLWCADYRRNGQALNATKMLVDNGAELIVNGSSSPWTYGKNGARDRRVRFLQSELGDAFVPFAYVNVVGAQNNGKDIITFDGGSTVYGRSGAPIQLAGRAYAEEMLVVEDLEGPEVVRPEGSKIAEKYAALVTGIRHLRDIRGVSEHPRVVVGMSGGIDSSVAAAVLVQAIGRERVLGVNMPTRYNSARTIQAAALVAERLGIAYGDVPIGELVDVNQRLLGVDLDGSGKVLSSLNEENVQAKIRGTSILSNLAAKYGGVFSNNGNKLEIALGYATLYGDWGGAVSILGDLTKTEVYQLATHLNDVVYGREIIPPSLIPDALFRFGPDQIAPSAELREAQLDPMKFGYHCALLDVMTGFKKRGHEDLLRAYLDGTLHTELGIPVALMERWGVDVPAEFLSDLDWFLRNVNDAVFKRVQSPPIIVTSKSAYGYDIRESMLPWTKSRASKALEAEIRARLVRYAPKGA